MWVGLDYLFLLAYEYAAGVGWVAAVEGEQQIQCWEVKDINLWAGALHNNDQLPVIILGGAGCRIKGGRALDYTGKPNRQLSRLFLSMMDKMEVRPKSFGDGKQQLEEV